MGFIILPNVFSFFAYFIVYKSSIGRWNELIHCVDRNLPKELRLTRGVQAYKFHKTAQHLLLKLDLSNK